MNISEKVKGIVSGVVDQLLEAVNDEFKNALQDALSSIRGNGLPLRQARVPVPREAVQAAGKGQRLCKQDGCAGIAVPRYRNYCKDHKELAALEGKSKKRKARRNAKKKAA